MRLTLAETSARTGVAVSTLSKVENGQLSLTYDKLVQLSEGLEIDISTFFDPVPANGEEHDAAADGPPQHHAARRRVCWSRRPDYDYRYLCTDLSRKGMVPILITIRARATEKLTAFSSHSGEEFIYVLRGTIEVHTEFYEPTLLAPGRLDLHRQPHEARVAVHRPESATVLNICWSPTPAISARSTNWR